MTTNAPCATIILAAGKGSRMKSKHSKILHQVAGLPLVCHVLKNVAPLKPAKNIVVASPDNCDAVKQTLADFNMTADIAIQQGQNGTAHATASAGQALSGFTSGTVLVLFGDTPFVSADTLNKMLIARENASIVVLGFETNTPTGYGRLVMNGDTLDKITEEKDATPAEKQITLCNSGVMAVDAGYIFDLIEQVNSNNAQGEYYLTDLPQIAKTQGLKTTVVTADMGELQGINSREQLAQAEHAYQTTRRKDAMAEGVTLIDPNTVYFAHDTVVENDVVIEPNVFFGDGVTVKTGATIRAFSHIQGATVGENTIIGPYARLRPGAVLENGAKVGNFVEIKNATIGNGGKVNHLSYIGDATVGAGANIGAGTITCNYDGFNKYKTTIGAGAFVGSNTALVAPVTIGDNAMVGAGSTVTTDVATDDLFVARGTGKTLTHGAKKFRAKSKKS